MSTNVQGQFAGRVKFYKADKGWGFIEPSTGGGDIFVHVYDLTKSGVAGAIFEGEAVTYELADSDPVRKPGKQKAVNIRVC